MAENQDLGGGTYWAFLPDITIASEDAYFQMPLVQGLGFPGGETMVEPWTFMNRKRAAEYLYTAKTLTAAEALDVGLINRVVPREELEETVDEMADHIARAPLSTLMGTKSLLVRAWELIGLPDVGRRDVDHGEDQRRRSGSPPRRRRRAEAARGG